MKAKRISQKAVKNMINGNTALLHIGNFDTGKRTNLKRAVSEVELYKTHIPTPPLQPTVNKKPKPIANKFTTWFLTTIQQAIASI